MSRDTLIRLALSVNSVRLIRKTGAEQPLPHPVLRGAQIKTLAEPSYSYGTAAWRLLAVSDSVPLGYGAAERYPRWVVLRLVLGAALWSATGPGPVGRS
jgi:hypothetical protein